MNTGNQILVDSDHFEKLSKYGVLHIPFLSPVELDDLRKFYHEIHNGQNPPTLYNKIHMTIWHTERDYKLRVSEGIKTILQSACDRVFQNYRAISQQFIVKLPGDETDFPVHQDWSIVDEGKHVSLNLWLALQDVDENNGAMWVVQGSHNIDRKVRGPGYLFPDYTGISKELRPIMTQFPIKSGEALLFFHSTVHGSPFNSSDSPRIAIQTSIIPKNAPLQVYFQRSEEDGLELHQPKDDFAFNYKRVREDSGYIPPTDKPIEVREPMLVPPLKIEEVRKVVVG